MRIQPDKIGHLILGALTCAMSAGGAWVLGLDALWCGVVGVSSALLVGIGKEIYDEQHPINHTADIWDAIATLIGGLGFAGLIALGRALKHLLLLTALLFFVGCGGAVIAKSATTPAEAATRDMLHADESLRTRVNRLEIERTTLTDRIASDTDKLAATNRSLSAARADLAKQRLRVLAYALFGLAAVALIASLWLPVAKRMLAGGAAILASLGVACLTLQAIWSYLLPVSLSIAALGAFVVIWRLRNQFGIHSQAIEDAAHFGDQCAESLKKLGASSEITRLKGEAIARQLDNGSKSLIESALAKLAPAAAAKS